MERRVKHGARKNGNMKVLPFKIFRNIEVVVVADPVSKYKSFCLDNKGKENPRQ